MKHTGREFLRHFHLRFGLRTLLAAGLLIVTLAAQVAFCGYTFRALTGRSLSVQPPLAVDDARTVEWCPTECRKAGIGLGDIVLQVQGKHLSQPTVLTHAIASAVPGEVFTVLIQRPSGSQQLRQIVLVRYTPQSPRLPELLLWLFVFVLAPGMIQLLGAGVLLAQKKDKRAYLLMLLLASFCQTFRAGGDYGEVFIPLLVYRQLAVSSFSLWLLAFAIVFPVRLDWDQKRPWIKFLLLAPFALDSVLWAALTLVRLETYGTLSHAPKLVPMMTWLGSFRALLALVVFLGIVGWRWLVAQGRDARQRILVLFLCTLLGLAPITLITSLSETKYLSPIAALLASWITPILLLTLIFPGGLIYIILFKKPTDLPDFLRSRTQYDIVRSMVNLIKAVSLAAAFLVLTFVLLSDADFTVKMRYALIIATLAIAADLVVHDQFSSAVHRYFRKERLDAQVFVNDVAFRRDLSPTDLLRQFMQSCAVRIQASWAIVLLPKDDELHIVGLVGEAPHNAKFEQGSILRWVDLGSLSMSHISRPFRLSRFFAPVDKQDRLGLRDLKAKALFGFKAHGSLEGVLLIGPKLLENNYSAKDLRFLKTTTSSFAFILQNAKLIQQLAAEIEERERKVAEKVAADEASRAKSDFLARMSHELRTPLNAIIGYSELLQEQETDREELSLYADLDKIRSAGKHLLSLINSILDISKIESGKVEIFLETVAMDELVDHIAGIAQPLMAKNNNRLRIQKLSPLGKMNCDAVKVRQILFNLLSNAAKFSKDNEIILQSDLAIIDGIEYVALSVQDKGIGMSEEQVKRIFQPFSQADETIAARYGGTGLGLSISRSFAALLGGELFVAETGPAVGTTFCLRLPRRRSESHGDLPQHLKDDMRPMVLIIEDDEKATQLLCRIAEQRGWSTVSVSSAFEAFEILAQRRPNLITLDVYLADEEGWALLKSLREDLTLSSVPIVMITISDEKTKAFSLGATDYLAKPVDRDALRLLLDRYRNEAEEMTVLIVEDDSIIRQRIARIVEDVYGCKVSEAANGWEAMEQLSVTVPTLIITDLVMPGMDGFAFLAELRDSLLYRDIPVIVMTSKELTNEERRLLSSRSSVVITKREQDLESTFIEILCASHTLKGDKTQ